MMARPHPLTLDKLETVLKQAGCPVCNEMEHATRRAGRVPDRS
jgi:hypothetical protein